MAQYINKDALVAEIKNRLHPVEVPHGTIYDDWDRGANSERLNILSFIDTLEVKEVDLDGVINRVWNENSDTIPPENWIEFKNITKYFFELGFKAQKGE